MSRSSEYICQSCRQVRKAGLVTGGKRYRCPDCGMLCPDCVDKGLLSSRCESCSKKVMRYAWDKKAKKWVNS